MQGAEYRNLFLKTDYVIAGDKAGSKIDKADSLGISIISRDEFFALFPDLTVTKE